MPLFDKKDKSRYATFTRRTHGDGRRHDAGVRGAGRPALSAADPRRRRIHDRGGREPRQPSGCWRRRAAASWTVSASNSPTTGATIACCWCPNRRPKASRRRSTPSARVILLSDAQKKRVLPDIAENKKFVPVPVAENLSWEEFSRINLHLPYLPGVAARCRRDPRLSLRQRACRMSWAMSPPSRRKDMTARQRSAADAAGFSHRQARHRKSIRRDVRGEAGAARVEVNAYGRVIRELGKDAGVRRARMSGSPSTPRCRRFADQRLGDESAACVVMDVTNGDVIAMASTPGFDPNCSMSASRTRNGTTCTTTITSR